MTDPQDRIEALVHTVPKVEKTHRQKVVMGFAVFFALIASVAFALSVVSIYGTAQVASCTNANLGTRSAPTANDARAHIAQATAQGAYDTVEAAWHASLSAVLLAPKSQQPALYRVFLKADASLKQAAAAKATANEHYKAVLAADQAKRNANPLGKC